MKHWALVSVLISATACTPTSTTPIATPSIPASSVSCAYVKTDTVPDPAFWAITESDGAQLIDPNSVLAQLINDRYDELAKESDGVVAEGDILIATGSSFVVDPEDLGVARDAIRECNPVSK